MTRFLTFHVSLPDLMQNPNQSGRHWSEKTRAPYRNEVKIDALKAVNAARWQIATKVRVSLTFGTKEVRLSGNRRDGRARPRDPDNAVASFKGGFDGLVDAGVMLDDNYEVMELGRVRIDPSKGPWVLVEVERLA